MTTGHDLGNPLRHVEYPGRVSVYMENDCYNVTEWARRTGLSQHVVRKKCRAGCLAEGWLVKKQKGGYIIEFESRPNAPAPEILRDAVELLELLRNAAMSSATFEAPIRMSIEFSPTGIWAAHLLSPHDNPALAAVICGSGRTSLELAFFYIWYSELDSPVLMRVARPKNVADSDWQLIGRLCIHCGKTLTTFGQSFCLPQISSGCYSLHFSWIDRLKKSESSSDISASMVKQLQEIVRPNLTSKIGR